MMRYLKILFLSIVVIGLMTGTSFAAASLNAGNTTVASELVPAAGGAIPTVNTGYEPGGAVAVTSQIKISLTNGTFTNATNVTICDSAGGAGGTYGTAVVAAPNTSVTITTTKLLASGTVYHFEPTAVCGAVLAPLTNVNIAAGAVGGSAVTMTVDNALSPGDTNLYAQAVVTTLVNQFSIELTPVTSVIGFLGGMKGFPAPGTLTSIMNFNILSNETIQTKIATGLAGNTVCAAMGAGGGKALTYTVTPGTGFNFSGIAAATGFSYTIAGAGGAVIDPTIATADASASGNVETATFMVCGAATSSANKALPANLNQLILTVDGTTVLTPRTYNIKIDTVTGAIILAGSRTVVGPTLGWTWKLFATQYYIPLVKVATGVETYIKLQSKSTVAGSNGVNVGILASDGSMVTVTPTISSITPGTPLLITGTDLASLVPTGTPPGKTVNGATGFAAIITVNSPEADVFCYANTMDASGQWKRIPVKTVGGVIVE